MCVAGVLYLIPSLSFLVPLAGLYGLYILYTGMKPMLKVPEDKMMGYFIVCLLSILLSRWFGSHLQSHICQLRLLLRITQATDIQNKLVQPD
jgi:hypothetical protein